MRCLKKQFPLPAWAIFLIIGAPIVFTGLSIFLQLRVPRVGVFSNEYIRAIPYRTYATAWGMPELLIAFMCIILGAISILAGAARTASRLPGGKLYLVGAFALLFGLNTWALTEYGQRILSPAAIYFLYWSTYFTYSLPLLFCMFLFFGEKVKTSIWPVLYLLTVYSLVAVFLLPFPFVSMEIAAIKYTNIMAVAFNTMLLVGVFSIPEKRASIFIRIYTIIFFSGQAVLFFMVMQKPSFALHDGFKNAVAITVFYMLGFILYDNAKETWETISHNAMLELRNQYILENFSLLKEHKQELAVMEHEMNHQLFALEVLCREQKYDQLLQTLKEIQNNSESLPKREYSGNPIIDAVLARAVIRAGMFDFTPELEIAALPSLSIQDGHLVSLITNLVENALEACEKIQLAQNRSVLIKVRSKPPYLYISVENTAEGLAVTKEGTILTSKTGDDAWKHGYGLEILENIVKKYNGFCRFRQEDGLFKAEIAVKCIFIEEGTGSQ